MLDKCNMVVPHIGLEIGCSTSKGVGPRSGPIKRPLRGLFIFKIEHPN